MFLAKFPPKLLVNGITKIRFKSLQPKNENYRYAHIIWQDINSLQNYTVFRWKSYIVYTAYGRQSSSNCVQFKGLEEKGKCESSSIAKEFGPPPDNLKPWLCSNSDSNSPDKTSVCIIGSGNFASAIATIIGKNAKQRKEFQDSVNMYVHPEVVKGKNLVDIINETHENVKYLKGIKIPKNIVAVPSVVDAAKNADILIFVLPHEFVTTLCEQLKGKIKKDAAAISLIKGFHQKKEGGLELISEVITRILEIPCSVLMGANLAKGVANGEFSEATIGCKDPKIAKKLRSIMQGDHYRVVAVSSAQAVEMCGALKNVVAVAAGFCDGMKLGDNTKAAVVRLGLMETMRYVEEFYPGNDMRVFFESCGVADFITTCYGGRNRKVAEAFVTQKKSIEELEAEMLHGQKLAGPKTAVDVNYMLKNKGLEKIFPIFTSVHSICTGKSKPQDLIKNIAKHPEHERTMKIFLDKYGEKDDKIDIKIVKKKDKNICAYCGCVKCKKCPCTGSNIQSCHRDSI